MIELSFNRRLFLSTSTACLLSACVTCGEALPDMPTEPEKQISDAHAHFFNASDLPINGFFKYVLARQYLANVPEVVPAIANLFARVIKAFSVSIERERQANLSQLSSKSFDEGISEEQFGDELAGRINASLKDTSITVREGILSVESFNAELNLADSYAALALLIKEYTYDATVLGPVDLSSRETFLQSLEVQPVFFTNIARGIEQQSERYDDSVAAPLNNQAGYAAGIFSERDQGNSNGRNAIPNVIDIFSWAFLLMRSRCYHVSRYLNNISPPNAKPSVALNLLVDYDKWLDDGPKSSSGHLAQVDFWHDYSKIIEKKIDIHTFAGFDPLKQAYENLQTPSQTHFSALKTRINNKKLQGFKIYPPMGFRAYGNEGQSFSTYDGIKDKVSKDWKCEFGDLDLGKHLDGALGELYNFCISGNTLGRKVPILAHGANSNAPGAGFGERANPKYWLDLVTQSEYSDLRVCLGHFTEARSFINIMNNYDANAAAGSGLWAIIYTSQLLKLSSKNEADFFTDIGYMEELLPKRGTDSLIARQFFSALFKYCKLFDENCERIMYGSDWLMLGIEKNHKNYTSVIMEAMNRTEWGKPENKVMKDNFLRNNLRRFLYLDTI